MRAAHLLPSALLVYACAEAETGNLAGQTVWRADASPAGDADATGGGGDRDATPMPPDAGADPDAGAGDAGAGCHRLDEAECARAFACHPGYCPSCTQGSVFVGCFDQADPLPTCEPSFMPCADPCVTLDETACNRTNGCHSVYWDPGTCDCQPLGCCMRFERCAVGEYPDCTGEHLTCRQAPPACGGEFTVSYQDTCYEGCVRGTDCPI